MDLLSTVRKQGTRGGRAEFKWEDVKSSQHRENYLGHSVMAPVGRWQSGRDLNWYAKSAEDRQKTEAEIIAEEKRLIKEQENEMIRQKFGDAAVTSGPPANANLTSLGPRKAYVEDRKDDKHASSEHREHRKHRHHRGRRSRSPSRDRSRERERYRIRLDDTDRHRSSRRERRRDRSRSRSRSPHRRRHNDHPSRDHRESREDGALPRRHKDSRDDKGTFDKYRRERDHDRRRYDRRSQEEEDGRGGRHRDSRRRSRSPD